MKMLTIAAIAATTLALSGCGDAPDETATTETDTAAPVDALLPGAFMVRTEVTSIESLDDADPATPMAVGQVVENEVCVGEDGILPAAAFGEDGDDCSIDNPYQRKGRLRQALTCNRSAGQLNLQVEAEFTGESLEGTVRTGSSFAGDGDYQMARTLTATRTGDCSNAEANSDMDADASEAAQ